jgi:hypothetical protein
VVFVVFVVLKSFLVKVDGGSTSQRCLAHCRSESLPPHILLGIASLLFKKRPLVPFASSSRSVIATSVSSKYCRSREHRLHCHHKQRKSQAYKVQRSVIMGREVERHNVPRFSEKKETVVKYMKEFPTKTVSQQAYKLKLLYSCYLVSSGLPRG